MNKLTFGALALLLLSGTSAIAQQRGDRDRDRDRDFQVEIRGNPQYSRGDNVPREYMGGQYLIHDYRSFGLARPGRGQQWLLVGNRYLLVQKSNRQVRDVRVTDEDNRWRGRERPKDNDRWDDRDDNDRNNRWKARYKRSYTSADDSYYTECRNQPDPGGVLLGAVLGGLLGNTVAGRGDRTGATVAGVIAGGAIAAAVTNKLDCDDRSYAYKTYANGFNTGRANATYTWNNPRNNNRGDMRVNNYYDDPDGFRCANYTQTVYIGGRVEEARGRACRQPDGNWAMLD
jgi:surface antigen